MKEEPFLMAIAEAMRELDGIRVQLQELSRLQIRATVLQQFLESAAAVMSEPERKGLEPIEQVLRDNRAEVLASMRSRRIIFGRVFS